MPTFSSWVDAARDQAQFIIICILRRSWPILLYHCIVVTVGMFIRISLLQLSPSNCLETIGEPNSGTKLGSLNLCFVPSLWLGTHDD